MNELFYEVTGTELLVLHQDKPDSTYVKLVLASPARNKYGIGASFYAEFTLESLKQIIDSEYAKKIISDLMASPATPYKEWIGKAHQMFEVVRKELWGKTVKLRF